jgi:hypothetical protein
VCTVFYRWDCLNEEHTLHYVHTKSVNSSRLLFITAYIGLYTYADSNSNAVVGVLCSCCRYEVRPISDLLQKPLRSAFDKASTEAYLAAKDAAWEKVDKCPKTCAVSSKGFHASTVLAPVAGEGVRLGPAKSLLVMAARVPLGVYQHSKRGMLHVASQCEVQDYRSPGLQE